MDFEELIKSRGYQNSPQLMSETFIKGSRYDFTKWVKDNLIDEKEKGPVKRKERNEL